MREKGGGRETVQAKKVKKKRESGTGSTESGDRDRYGNRGREKLKETGKERERLVYMYLLRETNIEERDRKNRVRLKVTDAYKEMRRRKERQRDEERY